MHLYTFFSLICKHYPNIEKTLPSVQINFMCVCLCEDVLTVNIFMVYVS